MEEELEELRVEQGKIACQLNILLQNEHKNLHDFEVKVFSQYGEDGILDWLCHKLQLHNPRILEFGASDFSECNSRFLIRKRLAQAVLIDANPYLPKNVQESYESLASKVIAIRQWITRENAKQLYKRSLETLNGLDIFSLDLDGNDYWILEELSLDTEKIVVLEYNPFFGERDISSIYRPDFQRMDIHPSGDLYGGSLSAYIRLMEGKGFSLVGTNRVKTNAFFIRRNLMRKLPNLDFNNLKVSDLVQTSVQDQLTADGVLNRISYEDRIKSLHGVEVFDFQQGLPGTL